MRLVRCIPRIAKGWKRCADMKLEMTGTHAKILIKATKRWLLNRHRPKLFVATFLNCTTRCPVRASCSQSRSHRKAAQVRRAPQLKPGFRVSTDEHFFRPAHWPEIWHRPLQHDKSPALCCPRGEAAYGGLNTGDGHARRYWPVRL